MRAGLIGVVLVLVLGAALLGDLVSPVDPDRQQLANRLQAPGTIGPDGVRHWLGTDHLGRDLFARTMAGARVSVLVAVTGVLGSAVIGVGVGLAAGLVGGWLDDVLMTLVDAQLALPFTLVAISVGAVVGPSLVTVLAVLAATGWVPYARTIRAHVLALRARDFVVAARGLGGGPLRVATRHLLPSCASSVIVISSFAAAHMIVAEATVSFLGVGVPSWVPSWGSMIAEGRAYLMIAWWVVMVPALAVSLTVISINLAGDWLRDRLDPRERRLAPETVGFGLPVSYLSRAVSFRRATITPAGQLAPGGGGP